MGTSICWGATDSGTQLSVFDSSASKKQLFIFSLKQLAKNVNLSRFRKHPRGPRKQVPKRKFDPKHPYVSTARLLANRRKSK